VTRDAAIETLLADARRGGRRALGRLITVAELGGAAADALDRRILDSRPPDWIVGVVGAPGVGKSTLTGRLVAAAADDGRAGPVPQVAVIAVDPSSPVTGGAILGDRIRMHAVGFRPDVFVRSMAHRGDGGGLARAVPIAIRVLGSVGVATVIVETVGVGQIELEIIHVADTVIAAMSPGWGDAIQAAKAGLLEVADLFAVNKADRPGAADAVRDLEQMLDAGRAQRAGDFPAWRPPVHTTVATDGTGIDGLWATAAAHREWLVTTGELDRKRSERIRHEIGRRAKDLLARRIDSRTAELDLVTSRQTPEQWAVRVAEDVCALAHSPGVDVA
jgi:LAO/AO transport system kinase